MMSPLPAGGVVEAIKADRRKLSRKLIRNRQLLDRSTMGGFARNSGTYRHFGFRLGTAKATRSATPARTAEWAWNSEGGAGSAGLAGRVIVFRERANAGRWPQDVGFDLGLARDDGDGPPRRDAQLAFQDRSNVARDRRSARLDGGYPTIELRDAETPDFLLVGRLKRKHAALFCCCNYRR
jgi:hypothetical protein